MKLFGSDKNFGMTRKNSDWFGMNFNPKYSSGQFIKLLQVVLVLISFEDFFEGIR